MNTIVTFRKCTLTDEELIKKVDRLTDEMYMQENGNIPSQSIPARPNEEYDLLIGELLIRFKELSDLHGNI